MSYRKTVVGLLVASVILALSGCGTAEAKSMNGTWKSPDFVAHIKPNHIDIYIINEGSAFLYWRGDFVRRDRTFFSKADTRALDNAILGSEHKTKMFHLSKNGRLWFQFSAVGMHKIITMRQI